MKIESIKQLNIVILYVGTVAFVLGFMIGDNLGGREWKRTANVFGDIGLELGKALNRQHSCGSDSGNEEKKGLVK